MSSKTNAKWVSTRVLQQKQQQGPTTGPTGGNSSPGSKIMEDKAIAAARIREHQGNAGTELEVPKSKVFEVQDATDALSNLGLNSESLAYELCGKPVMKPCHPPEEFHALMVEQIEKQGK